MWKQPILRGCRVGDRRAGQSLKCDPLFLFSISTMDGYIKIYRKLLEWEWYDDTNTKVVFLHCLLKANYADREWRGITIKRGQFLTSVANLTNELNLTGMQVRTALNKLQTTNEIAIQTTNKYSIISVCNYDRYQVLDDDEQQTNYQSNEQSNNNQITNKQQTNNNNIRKKERKNINNIDIKNNIPNGDIVKKDDFDFRQSLIEKYQVPADVVEVWLTIRKKKKANNSKLALEALVREAGRAGISVPDAVRMAAERSWQSFQACYIHDNREVRPTYKTATDVDDAERRRIEAEIERERAEAGRRQAAMTIGCISRSCGVGRRWTSSATR